MNRWSQTEIYCSYILLKKKTPFFVILSVKFADQFMFIYPIPHFSAGACVAYSGSVIFGCKILATYIFGICRFSEFLKVLPFFPERL